MAFKLYYIRRTSIKIFRLVYINNTIVSVILFDETDIHATHTTPHEWINSTLPFIEVWPKQKFYKTFNFGYFKIRFIA